MAFHTVFRVKKKSQNLKSLFKELIGIVYQIVDSGLEDMT